MKFSSVLLQLFSLTFALPMVDVQCSNDGKCTAVASGPNGSSSTSSGDGYSASSSGHSGSSSSGGTSSVSGNKCSAIGKGHSASSGSGSFGSSSSGPSVVPSTEEDLTTPGSTSPTDDIDIESDPGTPSPNSGDDFDINDNSSFDIDSPASRDDRDKK